MEANLQDGSLKGLKCIALIGNGRFLSVHHLIFIFECLGSCLYGVPLFKDADLTCHLFNVERGSCPLDSNHRVPNQSWRHKTLQNRGGFIKNLLLALRRELIGPHNWKQVMVGDVANLQSHPLLFGH